MRAAELVAVVLAVAYLVLAIRQSVWCWPCAFISTGIYIVLFHEVALFMESALNAFYLAMAVYGFWVWTRGGPQGTPRAVHVKPWVLHAVAAAGIALLVVVSGNWLAQNTPQALPYLDAFTTWSAVFATWLTAQKAIENWFYWLVIDIVSIGLYLERGLPLTALLFVLYVVLIPIGFLAWRRDLPRPELV